MAQDEPSTRGQRLVEAALALPASQREAFIERECAGDHKLARWVTQRLSQFEETTTVGDGAPPTRVPRTSLVGQTIDRYRVEALIGHGGMGVVYRAHDERLDRAVALKMLSRAEIDDTWRERFLREARAAATLNHPNVVGIYDAGETAEGCPYLVMELVTGGTLASHPPQALDQVLEVARQICDALTHAHERDMVHRDLKPGNVLLQPGAEGHVAKLADMGLALTRGSSRITRTGSISGTPTYLAPEQALGKQLDPRADLYALGVMLYEWTTGQVPFRGDDALAVISQHIHAPVVPPRTYRSDLSHDLEAAILCLLAKDPAHRFESAAQLRQALAASSMTSSSSPAPSMEVTIDGLARGRLVGREAELGQLLKMWQTARGGRSLLALISGEPGVGKTRLARELTASARVDGALVMWGGCYENEATLPYLPFVEALRRWVKEQDDATLTDTLADAAAELARLAPEISARLGPFPATPELPTQEERLRLFDHVARLLRRLAAERGLLFFVDDLHWGDRGTLALLHYLLRQLESEPVFFLATYRDVELDRTHPLAKSLVDWNRERLALRVPLGRLNHEATKTMISTLLGSHDITGDFIGQLHHETEGNPFFVEETVKALIAAGGLVHEASRWRRRDTGEVMLPQSVKAAIGTRLDRISPTCIDALRAAAVVGKQFYYNELAVVTTLDEDELLDALDEAVHAQLVSAEQGELFVFTHDKIREVLYEELNPIRRRRLHANIAEGLLELQKQGAEVAVQDLAHHFAEGGSLERGMQYAIAAAEAAKSVFAVEEVIEMYQRARECAEGLNLDDQVLMLDEAMGDAATGHGELAQALPFYDRALDASNDTVQRNRLRCKIGEILVTTGDQRGLEAVRRAQVELDAEKHPEWVGLAKMVEGRYRHLAGQSEAAMDDYQEALKLAEAGGDDDLVLRVLANLAGSLQHLARFDESDEFAWRCVEVGKQKDIPSGQMLGYEFLSENRFYCGEFAECVRFGELEEQLAVEYHARERYAWSRFRLFSMRVLGQLQEAEAMARDTIELSQRLGEYRLELYLRLGLVACLMDLGRLDEATQVTDEVAKAVDATGLKAHRLVARTWSATVKMYHGDFGQAAKLAAEALAVTQTGDLRGVELIYGAMIAEPLIRGGALDEAETLLERHRLRSEDCAADYRLAQNARCRGLLWRERGDAAKALEALNAAIEGFEAAKTPIDQARALADRAAVHRDRNNLEQAEQDRRRSKDLLIACGASPSTIV